MNTAKRIDTTQITYAGMLTALVAVFQYLGGFIRLGGNFSISLVLIPIVIGAAICGTGVGAWLGFVFGIMVFVTGDAALFLSINAFGTVVTVMAKGVLAGAVAGAVYKLAERLNIYLAVFLAAIVCPIVNTGVFLVGCRLFFFDAVSSWAVGEGLPVGTYMILMLVGLNFVFELIFNIVLAPIAVRLINIVKKLSVA